ncbi:hypothetical protein [Novosphingobium sp. ST904]|uniref:hypothetical protein n=1 Tax=Novosphingobium sp. ST904 TaxID=1684385 RepID=UPI000A61B485
MMDDDIQEGGDPAEAFDRLRAVIEGQDRELALLRRAVEGLAAERAHIDIPDYSAQSARSCDFGHVEEQRLNMAIYQARSCPPIS